MSASRACPCVLFVCTLLFATFFSMVTHAQVIILQSSVKKYKPGVTIGKAASVDVPDGKTILVMLPSGVTRKINGPFSGSVRQLATSGGRSNAALFKTVANYIKTGGATASSVGATRSALDLNAPQKLNVPFSWNTLHVRAAGDICIDKNRQVNIARSAIERPMLFNIIDLTTSKRAQIVFPAGMKTSPWPRELQLQNGNYGILAKGRKIYQVRIRLLDKLPASENILQVLHGQRCTSQLKAYLRKLATQEILQVAQ